MKDDRSVDAVFFALSDPTRRAVIRRLSERRVTATELSAEIPVSRQAIAKHLAVLKEAGLVEPERSGREVRFHLTPRPMGEAASWIDDVGAEWDRRLGALRRHLRG
jgi:DNA-binding transcriptional ArsR family regulator